MTKSQLVLRSFLHALGVLAYVSLVSWVMHSLADSKMPDNVLAPVAFLLLFVISAAIVGMLVFAKPVIMFLDNLKKEALLLAIYTICWLAVFTTIVFMVITQIYYLK
jgi:hypothetical protein